jgi:hypothetical protein
VQHVIHAGDGATGHVEVCQVALQEFHTRQVREIVTFARDEAVDYADSFAASHELLSQVGPDKAGTAGNKVIGHNLSELSKKPAGSRSEPAQSKHRAGTEPLSG